MASSGVGSSSHLSGELFKMMAGVELVHVAYRGQASALTDLLGGQVQMDFATMPPAIEYVRTGKLCPQRGTIEIDVRPRRGARPVCSGCHQPAAGYDHLGLRH